MSRWLQPGVRVALIGDSQMTQLGPRLQRALQQAGISVPRVEANVGWSVHRYIDDADIAALTTGIDVAVIELGGNDAAAGISPGLHAADVVTFLSRVRAPHVIWVGPSVSSDAELEAKRQRARDVEKRVVEGAGYPWINGGALTRVSDIHHATPENVVHFTGTGYDYYAGRLLEQLLRAPSAPLPEWLGPAAIAGAATVLGGILAWRFWPKRLRR